MSKRPVHIVWFKRDLRAQDHAPLFEAAKRGDVLPLYVVEPDYWTEPNTSARQWKFIAESLIELNEALQSQGSSLIVKFGDVLETIQSVSEDYDIKAIFSHEETGNGWIYARGIAVKNWCNAQSIPWQEYQ